LFSAGDFMEGPASNVLLFEDDGAGIYKKLLIENDRLKGVVLFGDTADGLWYQGLIRSGADVSHLRDVLTFGPSLALPQAA
jgi:nitrite reductase (NADH) large subunit